MTEHRIDNAEVTAGSNRWSPGPNFLGLSWHPVLKKLRWSAFEQLLSLLVAVVAVFLAVSSQFPTFHLTFLQLNVIKMFTVQ